MIDIEGEPGQPGHPLFFMHKNDMRPDRNISVAGLIVLHCAGRSPDIISSERRR